VHISPARTRAKSNRPVWSRCRDERDFLHRLFVLLLLTVSAPLAAAVMKK
jgi:hypothetical protein